MRKNNPVNGEVSTKSIKSEARGKSIEHGLRIATAVLIRIQRGPASVQNSPNSNGIPKTELQFIFTTDRASCDTNHRIDARAAPLRPVPVPLQLSHKCSCRKLLYISRHSLSLFLQTMAMKFPTPILDHLSPQILQNGMHAFVPNCFRHKGAT
jgi:hypothetical protein